jgi:surface polysaccharide O-acyltransferase-like enzyme
MSIGCNYSPLLFVFVGWVGYYLLGPFLLKSNSNSRITYFALILGLIGATVGDAVSSVLAGPRVMGFFNEYLIFTIITASAALFLILATIRKGRFENNTMSSRLLHWIRQNTLPIYLIHIMVLETIQAGWLGFGLNGCIMIPIIEVPLLTAVTLLFSAAIVYPLMKIPYLKRLIC